ncbi:uncharacterized protein LOC109421993 [Aedes albopictus]|uniref:Secreted protein n=1 Tax=Aedes albopictus TaxID=7160 RepID=A0ABM1YU55_AEDAL|nr:uncharacterized protein LOC109421993 [Aedes albopictus]KXJ70675.1 hypothetical protein RP20_CCG022781 [Aedes albopictus]
MKHQQVVPDYSAMVQTSGTVLCLVFSGWVLFRLVQAVFWLPGYLEQSQGKLYEQIERKDAAQKPSTKKAKAKDSDAEEENDDGEALVETSEEKGNDDANEREKTGNKKEN